ncbi:hybrid sensor histidine kinase/response regulator [Winogradskyella sediminis]|uniref:histidine kinase n=1 Tax=Winogradskyella sediminis TaxID=1382466 RepID=A0A1H1QFF6_9FLAO|nr:response regulator [Winogradskyella sediminis]SDS22104.1 His Kinase A (phospho-acceptor) domain-containing protein [Winogradskyella sediminis]
MCFPKSNTVIVLFIALITNVFFANAQESLVNTDSSSYSFNSYKLNSLVRSDSLYEAAVLIHNAIAFSKKNGLKNIEAESYNAYGQVLTKMSNFQKAEIYHTKALQLYDSLDIDTGRDLAYSGLLNAFVLAKNYSKFDSLYPKAQDISKKLNSEIYFINLEYKIKKAYYSFDNIGMLNSSNFALSKLKNSDFITLNPSLNYPINNLKENLFQSYKYYNAIAQIKLSDFDAKDYGALFAIDEDKLKASIILTDVNSYRKLASLNYYKYLYYTNSKKNLDSANKYLLKSDTYKYQALNHLEYKIIRNGALVHKIINAEEQLAIANEIRNKAALNSKRFAIITIIMSITLAIILTSFYFYFKAKKNITKVNEALKQSNSKLLAIDKDRLEFFSILSHELRTPIYGINGLAILINQENDTSKKQSYLESLISSSNYLSILIDNILQANRLKFENKNLRLKPDKIEKIVSHVVSTIAVAAKNKDLELRVHIDESDDNEYILIDKVAFSQILINLAYNAIRYTKKGHITINVFEKSRENGNITLRFEVNDTGIGIKEEHRSIVFSAFENKTFLNKNSSGSGLGLYIVKTLLKSHNSDIDFVSTPNEGTSFFFEITFQLSMATAHLTSASTSEKRSMHVLIVDDNKINLLITKKNIEKIEGYTCVTISNGKEAICLAKEKDFDLILMDINMPDMDGYEVTKHVRMFNPNIPILALTALNSSEISTKAEAAGIDQIITKPYIFEDFKAIIISYRHKRNQGNVIEAEAI